MRSAPWATLFQPRASRQKTNKLKPYETNPNQNWQIFKFSSDSPISTNISSETLPKQLHHSAQCEKPLDHPDRLHNYQELIAMTLFVKVVQLMKQSKIWPSLKSQKISGFHVQYSRIPLAASSLRHFSNPSSQQKTLYGQHWRNKFEALSALEI